jgi:hypothetical protein
VAADGVRRGQRVLVKPGERIPVEDRVAEGRGAVNQTPIAVANGLGMSAAIHAVAMLILLSGLVVLFRMRETLGGAR